MPRTLAALCLLLAVSMQLVAAGRVFNLSQSLPMASTNFHPYNVWVTRTTTRPAFWIPVYREAVSRKWETFAESIVDNGFFEREETDAFLDAIRSECRTSPGSKLVLDVGGFNGYYTMLAAASGCRVQVWEAQPQNVQMVQLAVLLNRAWSRVKVHHNICSNGTKPLRFSGTAMDGHVSGTYQHSDNPNRKAEMQASGQNDDPKEGAIVYPLSLDSAVPEGQEVVLLKVDVEGHEPYVLNGAVRLLRQQAIKQILMEYNLWRSMTVDEGVAMMDMVMSFGYHVYVQPTPNCPQRRKINHINEIREVSVQLRDNTYPCASWAVYLMCTVAPLAA